MSVDEHVAPGRRAERFAAGVAISVIGDGVRYGAAPLLALRAGASASQISLLFAAGALPWLLVPLAGGALVDRVDRRRLLVSLDLLRAAIIASLAVLALVVAATPLVVLGAVLFAMGACEVVYTSGLVASLPAVVDDEDRLVTANARLAAAQDVGQDLIGPAAGGALFALAAPLPFALDALSFVVCAALVASVAFRPAEGGGGAEMPARPQSGADDDVAHALHAAGAERPGLLDDVRAGVRWLRGRRELLALAIAGGVGNMANLAALSVTSWLVVRELGGSEAAYGLVLTVEALAGLAVAPVLPALSRRVGEIAVIGASFALEGAGYAIAALAPSVPAAFVGFACVGASAMGWNVVAPTVRQRRVPDALRGRVDSVYRVVMYGGSPLGAVLAGVMAGAFGVRGALAACAVALLVTCIYVFARLLPWFARAEVASMEGAA